MKRFKQVIFFIAVIALFAIVGGMDQNLYSPETGLILSTVDYIILAWSGFGAGLFRLPEEMRGKIGQASCQNKKGA